MESEDGTLRIFAKLPDERLRHRTEPFGIVYNETIHNQRVKSGMGLHSQNRHKIKKKFPTGLTARQIKCTTVLPLRPYIYFERMRSMFSENPGIDRSAAWTMGYQ